MTSKHKMPEKKISKAVKKGKEDGWIAVDPDVLRKCLKVGLENETESKDADEKAVVPGKLGALLAGFGNKLGRGRRGMYFRTKLHYGGSFATNGTTGKYLVQWPGGVTAYYVNNVANGGEWTSFNSVFEECFIHSMEMKYEPMNQYMGQYVSSTAGNVQSCLAVVSAYQHDQTVPTDSGTTYYQLMNSQQSRVVNTGRAWTFTWRNIEKFDRGGTVGDASTANHTQSWINMLDIAKYGGYISAGLPFATGTASNSVFAVNTALGIVVVSWDISFRYRD